MNRGFALICVCCAITLFVPSPAAAVTIAMVPVGSPGNSPDPATGSLYGAVPYNYRIGTYDITNAQWAEFLNAKASIVDRYGLWDSLMAPSDFEGAISRSGTGPYVYSVKPGYANKPVVYVSWYGAVRFVNWFTNGQGNGDTESGTYKITNGSDNYGIVVVPDLTTRLTWANTNSFHWILPSENEWYKAAYYNAPSGTYYSFPFQSNLFPASLAPPGSANSGDFKDISSNTYPAYNYDGNGSYLTDVGAYPNSRSPFGAFDMSGDVYQLDDTRVPTSLGTFPVMRGGYWPDAAGAAGAFFRYAGVDPTFKSSYVGFRVASVGSVPEPSTGLLAVLACGLLWWNSKSIRRVA
jgi:formylglycine-generating enzyme